MLTDNPLTAGRSVGGFEPAPAPRRPAKAGFLAFHRWIGASLGLLLLLQGMSGAALVFRDRLEPVLHAELSVATSGERLAVHPLIDPYSGEILREGGLTQWPFEFF